VWRQRLQTFKKHPLSLLAFLLIWSSILITIALLIFIAGYILVKGVPYITLDMFALQYTSDNLSIVPAIVTTIYMVILSLMLAAPLGIMCAIYLVEYAKRGNRIVKYVRLTAETLSGIPSIVYGLFGLLFFVTALHWGFSLLAGACTLSIMILPLIMRATEEALISVPDAYREGAYGLGAGKLRTIFVILLPSAMPGILSGIILAIGRIVGETAALIYTAGTVAKIPTSTLDSGRTLAIHMYVLSSEGLHTNEAYATAVVLLITVFIINALASRIAAAFVRGK